MTSFAEVVESARRLAVLRSLASAPEYTLPEATVRESLKAHGLAASSDQMAAAAAWLDEQRLLMRQPVGATHLLTLTGRGLDVAEGTALVPGVDRPRPGQ